MDTRFVMSSGNEDCVYHKIENRLYPVWRNNKEVPGYTQFYLASTHIELRPVILIKRMKLFFVLKDKQ